MESYQGKQFRIQKTALPKIQAYYDPPVDYRFSSLSKKYGQTPTNIEDAEDLNLSMSEESIIELEDASETNNKSSSSGSVNDLPPTRDSSKISFRPNNQRVIQRYTPPEKKKELERVPPRRLKSMTPSNQKLLNTLDKPPMNLKSLLKTVRVPKISAKCWAVMDGKSGEILYQKKGNKKREIASLTKMMTCLCACKLIKQYEINPKEVYVQVSKYSSHIGGTSAHLEANDVLTIWDLLHGLMLPSGNDAALTLAENFGTYIYLKSEKYKAKVKQDPSYADKKVREPVKYFLCMMNKMASELGLKFTYYANSHGLVNSDSYSTAADQAKLTYQLLKWNMIREIVNTPVYECEVEQGDSTIRNVRWENTNKLLGRKGWQGVKTGVTTAAGPSLSAYYEDETDSYIIILLSSSSMEIRWAEAQKLVDWTNKHKKNKQNPA